MTSLAQAALVASGGQHALWSLFLQTTVLARAGGLLFCVSATDLIAAAERLW